VLNSVRVSFQRSWPESWAESWLFGYWSCEAAREAAHEAVPNRPYIFSCIDSECSHDPFSLHIKSKHHHSQKQKIKKIQASSYTFSWDKCYSIWRFISYTFSWDRLGIKSRRALLCILSRPHDMIQVFLPDSRCYACLLNKQQRIAHLCVICSIMHDTYGTASRHVTISWWRSRDVAVTQGTEVEKLH
jgi:hypothetical protein